MLGQVMRQVAPLTKRGQIPETVIVAVTVDVRYRQVHLRAGLGVKLLVTRAAPFTGIASPFAYQAAY